MLFNIDIVNFVWKTDEAESILLLIFVLWQCLNLRWLRVVEWGRKSYLGLAEIVSFSSRSFSHLNQILFKCIAPLLFLVIIFYYVSFDQQSSAAVLQNKAAGPQACNFIIKETPTQVFFCEISKTFKNSFFKEHIRWLLLYISYTHDVACNMSR